ncbi:glutathione S-transferase family protein [Novosphingopyxis sp.]|uniref:glutathione S-transferase family protein n=1 Tax=Novosphingopyxis sp. TaxID=2709690 RepID=UPI003B5CB6DA
MIRLHFAPLTRSIRIRWLLEELEVAYELTRSEFNRETQKGFSQATPSGNYPYMEDGSVTLSESGAIVQYILEQYGKGRLEPPIGSLERAAYLQWLHFAEGTAASPINTTVWLTVYRQDADRHTEIIEAVRESANTVFDRVEAALEHRPYLAGDELTAADIMMGFTLATAKWLNLLTDSHPRASAYVNRLFERPALQRALA